MAFALVYLILYLKLAACASTTILLSVCTVFPLAVLERRAQFLLLPCFPIVGIRHVTCSATGKEHLLPGNALVFLYGQGVRLDFAYYR